MLLTQRVSCGQLKHSLKLSCRFQNLFAIHEIYFDINTKPEELEETFLETILFSLKDMLRSDTLYCRYGFGNIKGIVSFTYSFIELGQLQNFIATLWSNTKQWKWRSVKEMTSASNFTFVHFLEKLGPSSLQIRSLVQGHCRAWNPWWSDQPFDALQLAYIYGVYISIYSLKVKCKHINANLT